VLLQNFQCRHPKPPKRFLKYGETAPRKKSHEPLEVRFWLYVDKKEVETKDSVFTDEERQAKIKELLEKMAK